MTKDQKNLYEFKLMELEIRLESLKREFNETASETRHKFRTINELQNTTVRRLESLAKLLNIVWKPSYQVHMHEAWVKIKKPWWSL